MITIFAQIGPEQAITQLASGTSAYVLAVGDVLLALVCSWLGRALIAAKDRLAHVEREHAEKVEKILTANKELAEEIRDLLVKGARQ